MELLSDIFNKRTSLIFRVLNNKLLAVQAQQGKNSIRLERIEQHLSVLDNSISSSFVAPVQIKHEPITEDKVIVDDGATVEQHSIIDQHSTVDHNMHIPSDDDIYKLTASMLQNNGASFIHSTCSAQTHDKEHLNEHECSGKIGNKSSNNLSVKKVCDKYFAENLSGPMKILDQSAREFSRPLSKTHDHEKGISYRIDKVEQRLTIIPDSDNALPDSSYALQDDGNAFPDREDALPDAAKTLPDAAKTLPDADNRLLNTIDIKEPIGSMSMPCSNSSLTFRECHKDVDIPLECSYDDSKSEKITTDVSVSVHESRGAIGRIKVNLQHLLNKHQSVSPVIVSQLHSSDDTHSDDTHNIPDSAASDSISSHMQVLNLKPRKRKLLPSFYSAKRTVNCLNIGRWAPQCENNSVKEEISQTDGNSAVSMEPCASKSKPGRIINLRMANDHSISDPGNERINRASMSDSSDVHKEAEQFYILLVKNLRRDDPKETLPRGVVTGELIRPHTCTSNQSPQKVIPAKELVSPSVDPSEKLTTPNQMVSLPVVPSLKLTTSNQLVSPSVDPSLKLASFNQLVSPSVALSHKPTTSNQLVSLSIDPSQKLTTSNQLVSPSVNPSQKLTTPNQLVRPSEEPSQKLTTPNQLVNPSVEPSQKLASTNQFSPSVEPSQKLTTTNQLVIPSVDPSQKLTTSKQVVSPSVDPSHKLTPPNQLISPSEEPAHKLTPPNQLISQSEEPSQKLTAPNQLISTSEEPSQKLTAPNQLISTSLDYLSNKSSENPSAINTSTSLAIGLSTESSLKIVAIDPLLVPDLKHKLTPPNQLISPSEEPSQKLITPNQLISPCEEPSQNLTAPNQLISTSLDYLSNKSSENSSVINTSTSLAIDLSTESALKIVAIDPLLVPDLKQPACSTDGQHDLEIAPSSCDNSMSNSKLSDIELPESIQHWNNVVIEIENKARAAQELSRVDHAAASDKDSDMDGANNNHVIRIHQNDKRNLLWKFILSLLEDYDSANLDLVRWLDRNKGLFMFVNTACVAKLWGETKRRGDMTFEKLSRSLRHYYKSGVMKIIKGRSHRMYQFNWDKVPKPKTYHVYEESMKNMKKISNQTSQVISSDV